MIIITHKLDEVLATSDAVTVMRDGRVVGNRKTAETSAAELARLMVGREVLLRVEKKPANPGAIVLTVRQLSMRSRHSTRVPRETGAASRLGRSLSRSPSRPRLCPAMAAALARWARPAVIRLSSCAP